MIPRYLLLLVYVWHLGVGAGLWLGDVEGYYWLWSRELQAGYLDHPPLDAWLLAGSTAIFGDTRFGVRFVPATLSLLTAWMMLLSAERLFGTDAGKRIALLVCLVPGFIVLGVAASPDAPVIAAGACIVWACVRAQETPSPSWVLLIGALIGVGLLGKLTMAHFAIGVVWAWASEPTLRAQLRWWSVLGAAALMLLCCSPMLLWNMKHDYAMLTFHAARIGEPSWQNAAKLLFGQLGYYSPFIAVAAWRGLGRSWLSKLAWPTLLLMVPAILCTRDAEPQWTALAYLPAILLLANEPARARVAIRGSLWLVGGALVIAHVHLLSSALVRLIPPSVYRPRVDLANDMQGWREVGAAAKEIAATLGPNTVLAAGHYTLCGQLGFATGDTPHVVCPTPRVDAFDLIPARAAPPLHANTVFLADDRFTDAPDRYLRFARCEKARHLDISRGDKVVRQFDLYACEDYLGPG